MVFYWILIAIICLVILIGIYFYFVSPYDIVAFWNSLIEKQTSPIFLRPEESNCKSFHDDLISHYDIIRQEILLNYEKGMPMNQLDQVQKHLMGNDTRWTAVWLRLYNFDIPSPMPVLTQILERHPEVVTCNISTLKPGVVLHPHHGPFAGVWRYHLGIQVPKGNLGIKLTTPNGVSGDYKWKEKEGIVFDDTLLHTAWNYTDNPRVVIFADVIKPFNGIKGLTNRSIIKLVQRSKHLSKIRKNIFAGNNISFN